MPLDLGRELIIDNFAGGGGTSTGQDSACGRPMATSTTKARMGLVQTALVSLAMLSPDHAERARRCAELLLEKERGIV